MTTPKFDWSTFNPDCLNSDQEFDPVGNYINSRTTEEVWKEWFPDQPFDVEVLGLIYSYIVFKMVAVMRRTDGKIQEAIGYEDMCQSFYLRLPDYAKW